MNRPSRETSSRRKNTKSPKPRVLLVQIDAVDQSGLQTALLRAGFAVMERATVAEALTFLATQRLDALICDLHLPAAGDGFTLINAMRHLHPGAITFILSAYPALRESVSALLPQADEVLVTPIPLPEIVKLLQHRLRDPKHRAVPAREPVATILERYTPRTISEWLRRVNANDKLNHLALSDEARTGHLRILLQELVNRLRTPHVDEGTAEISFAAISHGQARKLQGYTAAMLVEESRILQVCIFKTLRTNLNAVDLALVLTEVMTIADEVDSQLTQTMTSFAGQPSGPNRRRRVAA
jgi:DNA-binding response OmpR family regulator